MLAFDWVQPLTRYDYISKQAQRREDAKVKGHQFVDSTS